MNKTPLVSIIIPTKNSERFLAQCLESIKRQSYTNIEIVIVDNYSKDKTLAVAKRFTNKIFTMGPERSTQRNFGVKNARGDYVFFVDSDMEVSESVVTECIHTIIAKNSIKALVIPEESKGEGFWAQCKQLERSFYIGVNFMEAVRFFEKKSFLYVGGFDTTLISGEDWYLSQKIEKIGKIDRINSKLYHNEGKLTLIGSIKKKYYYARYFSQYMNLKDNLHLKEQTSILKRYSLFFSNPYKLFKNPLLGLGMLFLKTSEFFFGGLGYLLSSKSNVKKIHKYNNP